MEYKQEQAQLQRRTPQKLNTESAAYVKRNIITPAMQDLAERLAQLYNDILDAVELPDYNRRELNSLLNLQGAINPIYEQLKDIIIYWHIADVPGLFLFAKYHYHRPKSDRA